MLGAFNAVLLFGVGVRVASGPWTALGQAISSIPANLASTLRHLTYPVAPTIALASIWREGPDTLHHDRIENWNESLLIAITSAHHAYVRQAERCMFLLPNIVSRIVNSFALVEIRQ